MSHISPLRIGFTLLLFLGVFAGQATVRAQKQPLFTDTTQPQGFRAAADTGILRRRFVQVHPAVLRSLHPGDTFSLSLLAGVQYDWVVDSVSPGTRGTTVWSGHLKGFPLGQALLLWDGENLMGSVNTGKRVFRLRAIGSGIHLIEELDHSAFPEELPPLDAPTTLGGSATPKGGFAPSADDGSQIDVMVLYTPAARAAAGGPSQMQALVNLAVAETNQAYQNSGVTPRLNLVHTAEISYTESGNFNTDLTRLQGTSDGYMDNIHALRDTYHADLVSLIIEDTQYCGLGYFMDTASTAFAPYGFTVVARTCATGYYSFGHELGHNMGLQHDWYVDDGIYEYTYSHGYVNVGGGWRTIMAYNSECADSGGNCTRLQYFSNPNNTYSGAPMGVPPGTAANCVAGDLGHPACDAANYQVLNNNAYTVANFRVSGAPTATGTPSPTITPLPTTTPSLTITPSPTLTPSPTPVTPTITPGGPTLTPTMSPTATPVWRWVYLPLIRKDAPPTPTPTPTATPTMTPVPGFAQQVVDLVNQERQNAGCAPLTVDSRLQAAAQGHSEDMALNDFFSHTGSNGSSPWDRIVAQGYNFSWAGENIAAGYTTPQDVMSAWMSSPGHRDNILDCNFTDIGVGYYYLANDTGSVNYYHYWTQVFAAP